MEERITSEVRQIPRRLTTPRAAAVAGILFAVLLSTSLVLIRLAIPANPRDDGAWLAQNGDQVTLALNLVPFAGIAFLWFMGVLRDRIGAYEDRFFATVFLGSGLLFLALLFASAALAGGLIATFVASTAATPDQSAYTFGRATMYVIANVYAVRMAGVFIISTATIAFRTGIMPRWLVVLSYALALFLLLIIGFISWAILLFPLWVLLISVYILVQNYRGEAASATN